MGAYRQGPRSGEGRLAAASRKNACDAGPGTGRHHRFRASARRGPLCGIAELTPCGPESVVDPVSAEPLGSPSRWCTDPLWLGVPHAHLPYRTKDPLEARSRQAHACRGWAAPFLHRSGTMKSRRRWTAPWIAALLALAMLALPRTSSAGLDNMVRGLLHPPGIGEPGDPDGPDGVKRVVALRSGVAWRFIGRRPVRNKDHSVAQVAGRYPANNRVQ